MPKHPRLSNEERTAICEQIGDLIQRLRVDDEHYDGTEDRPVVFANFQWGRSRPCTPAEMKDHPNRGLFLDMKGMMLIPSHDATTVALLKRMLDSFARHDRMDLVLNALAGAEGVEIVDVSKLMLGKPEPPPRPGKPARKSDPQFPH